MLCWFGEHIWCHWSFLSSILNSLFLSIKKQYGPIKGEDICLKLWPQCSQFPSFYFSVWISFFAHGSWRSFCSQMGNGKRLWKIISFQSCTVFASSKSETQVDREGYCDSWNANAVKICLTPSSCLWMMA